MDYLVSMSELICKAFMYIEDTLGTGAVARRDTESRGTRNACASECVCLSWQIGFESKTEELVSDGVVTEAFSFS